MRDPQRDVEAVTTVGPVELTGPADLREPAGSEADRIDQDRDGDPDTPRRTWTPIDDIEVPLADAWEQSIPVPETNEA